LPRSWILLSRDSKLKAHGLLERDGKRYAYRLTSKGLKVAVLFILFHKQLCGPLANSLFHHRPDQTAAPRTKLEAALHKADNSLQHINQLFEAALTALEVLQSFCAEGRRKELIHPRPA
jgi:hypothetical protein